MKISTSNIQLASSHESSALSAVSERLRVWTDSGKEEVRTRSDEQEVDEGKPKKGAVSFDFEQELAKVSIEARAEKQLKIREKHRAEKTDGEETKPLQQDTKLELMRLIVEKISGKRVSLYDQETEATSEEDESTPDRSEGAEAEASAESAGFGIEYEYKEIYREAETTRFESQGVVTTEDGRRISFDIDMEMYRERIDVNAFSLRAGDAKLVDPLVINFGADPVALSESKMDFDLNSDGIDESVSFVQAGSGFLVLDRNRDGVINDGGEMFGPTTGDGFQELSAFDGDSNGWIDEADAIYDDLKIWTQGGVLSQQLRTLADSHVGAIYLGSVETPFELKSTENRLDGQIQSSGVFLKESGEVGTIQQVDLVT